MIALGPASLEDMFFSRKDMVFLNALADGAETPVRKHVVVRLGNFGCQTVRFW